MGGFSSSSARLTALLFVAIFVPTLAMLGFMSYASSQTLASQRTAQITELRDELLAEYAGGGPPNLADAIRDRLRFNPLGDEVLSYRSAEGKLLVGNIGTWPAELGRRDRWLETSLKRPGEREMPRMLDGAEYDPGAARLPRRRMQAKHGEVVGFGRTTREDRLGRLAAKCACDARPRRSERALRLLPEWMLR